MTEGREMCDTCVHWSWAFEICNCGYDEPIDDCQHYEEEDRQPVANPDEMDITMVHYLHGCRDQVD
jgi:hypothetical protein